MKSMSRQSLLVFGASVAWTCIILLSFDCALLAQELESHNNPVANGTIVIEPGNSNRSDWDGIPWYEEDEEDEAEPVDIHRIRVAHDQNNVYFHLETNRWEAPEAWRVGVFLDLDQDPETGFNGFNAATLGAEMLSEGEALWEFVGDQPGDWAWEQLIEVVPRDQTASMVDVEWSVPRAELGDPSAFDFRVLANNECCDFGLPLDYYPEFSNIRDGGDFFTYELGDAPLAGDFNANGELDSGDLDVHAQMIKDTDLTGDANGDGVTDAADRLVWIEAFQGSWAGDADFDGEFGSRDLVVTFTEGKYETGEMATYAQGDWNGDMLYDSSDFVFAFSHGGYEMGPRTSVAAVPEPTSTLTVMIAVAAFARIRLRARNRTSRVSARGAR